MCLLHTCFSSNQISRARWSSDAPLFISFSSSLKALSRFRGRSIYLLSAVHSLLLTTSLGTSLRHHTTPRASFLPPLPSIHPSIQPLQYSPTKQEGIPKPVFHTSTSTCPYPYPYPYPHAHTVHGMSQEKNTMHAEHPMILRFPLCEWLSSDFATCNKRRCFRESRGFSWVPPVRFLL